MNKPCFVIRCATLGLVVSLAAWPLGVAAAPNLDGIAAQIARSGKAQVTVHLSLPFVPEGTLSAAAAQQQRVAIGAAQDAFVQEVVQGTASRVLNRYAWMPALVLEIDAATLERIRRSKRVQAVEVDRLVQPSVAPGAPQ